MRKSLRRRAGVITAAAASLAVTTLVSPAAGWAEECGVGRTWDPVSRVCDPPPALPAWYQNPPTYAPPWAPTWAPPPPQPPADNPELQPVWDPRNNVWEIVPRR